MSTTPNQESGPSGSQSCWRLYGQFEICSYGVSIMWMLDYGEFPVHIANNKQAYQLSVREKVGKARRTVTRFEHRAYRFAHLLPSPHPHHPSPDSETLSLNKIGSIHPISVPYPHPQ